ncbi:OsmC family protein [Thioalbus denitrificans]|uniref:Putative OsmC-like protein n=1 Tax=Thioalbus denitrificans TaxID=547122 RepID=A0A369CAT9_9GAMM|nr:OsmC family protein [Thioalbus denitrificans]RCX30215.1 putative OsmC-like protein [Thioalbus denitrificans]
MSQENVRAALLKTIGNIQNNPSQSNVVFRASSVLEEDVRCRVQIREFPSFTIDEPPELGGQDSAPNPVELVLAALGTCQEIMYSAYASVMGVELTSVEVSARGYLDLKGLFGLDAEVPPGYKRITFDTRIESQADEETLARLIETVESHCPVLDILSRAIPVSGTASVNGRQLRSLQTSAA